MHSAVAHPAKYDVEFVQLAYKVWSGCNVDEPFSRWAKHVTFAIPLRDNGALAFTATNNSDVWECHLYSPGYLPGVRRARSIMLACAIAGAEELTATTQTKLMSKWLRLIGFSYAGKNEQGYEWRLELRVQS